MSAIKKVWLTQYEKGLCSMSLESKNVVPEYLQLHVETKYPSDGPTKRPRHVVILKLLNEADLIKTRDAIDQFLKELRDDQ